MLHLLGFDFACEQWSPKLELEKRISRNFVRKRFRVQSSGLRVQGHVVQNQTEKKLKIT